MGDDKKVRVERNGEILEISMWRLPYMLDAGWKRYFGRPLPSDSGDPYNTGYTEWGPTREPVTSPGRDIRMGQTKYGGPVQDGQTINLAQIEKYLREAAAYGGAGNGNAAIKAAAVNWLKDHGGPTGSMIKEYRPYTTPDGKQMVQIVFGGPRGSASNLLYGASPDRGDRDPRGNPTTYTLTFEVGKAEDAPTPGQAVEQKLSEWATRDRDPFFLRSEYNQISKGVAEDLSNRLLDLANWTAGTSYNMDEAIQEVQRVLNSTELGDPRRREILADMVLYNLETSAVPLQPPIDTGEPDDPFEDYVNAALAALAGASKQTYKPPDRREVEENVRAYLAATMANSSDSKLVNRLVEKYMSEHRRSWDNPELGILPFFSVKEEVRSLGEYQKIHALRPDTIDEMDWVTQYQGLIDQAGIPANLRDVTARDYAVMGLSQRGAQANAYLREETRTGQTQPLFLQNLRATVGAIARRF